MRYVLEIDLAMGATKFAIAGTLRQAAEQVEEMSSVAAAHDMKIWEPQATGSHGIVQKEAV